MPENETTTQTEDPRIAQIVELNEELRAQNAELMATLHEQMTTMEALAAKHIDGEPDVTVDEVAVDTLPEGTKRYRATIRELKLVKTSGKSFLFDGDRVNREEVSVEFSNGVYTTDDAEVQEWIESLPEFTRKAVVNPRGEPRPVIVEDALAHLTAPSVPVSAGVKQSGSTPRPESLTAPVH